jgi:hypothetical protein
MRKWCRRTIVSVDPARFREAANAVAARNRASAAESGADLEDIRENGQNAREMTWSEWQDLNLRPLRPEPCYCAEYL